ncbi:MAG: DUF4874 domain-containing protein [Burkholderiaceae bacterium]|nr:DUF4874 domain-containing protein [Burkholderiaceae bacterium]
MKAKSWLVGAAASVACLITQAAFGQEEPAHRPSVKISASSHRVFVGEAFTLTWRSENARICSASGAWSGAPELSGSRTVTLTSAAAQTYVLLCAGPAGSASSAVTVRASVPSLTMTETFTPNSLTIPTSEGSPYGFCNFWIQTPSDCSQQTNFGYGPTKVLQLYICLSGEVNNNQCSQQPAVTGPLSDDMLRSMEQRLAAFAGTGMRLLVRFTYNFGPIAPTSMDAPIDVISTHIDQVAPILQRHKDLIFALEAGFIGTWGEWHDSTNGNDTAAAQKIVLDKELGYFQNLFPILVRDPGDLILYTGTLQPQPGLGIHDDYYASNSSDAATWSPCAPRSGYCLPSYTSQQFQTYAADVSTATIFAGEFGAVYPTLQTCDALDQYSYTYHPQSISLHPYPPAVATFLGSEGCITDFYSKVGTRIVLQNVSVIGEAVPEGELHVTATMVNAGYGRVIRPRPVTLILAQQGQAVAKIEIPISRLDLRTLASSASPTPTTFQFDVVLPESLPLGPTAMGLVFHDPAPSLFHEAAYTLPLNSIDQDGKAVFDASTGFNRIATFDVTSGDE